MKNNFGKSLKKLITMRENTAGIYFTDSVIYISLLKGDDSADFVEYKIEPGLIKDGVIIDIANLSIELKKAIKQLGRNVTFANITIQSKLVYSNIIHTPSKITDKKQLEKAIELILNVELPWNKDMAYTDFCLIDGDENNTGVSIYSVKKEIIDSYISLFDKSPIKVLLIEFDSLSILRTTAEPNGDLISITATSEKADVIISNNRKITFLLPIKDFKNKGKEIVDSEITRLQNYYRSETGIEAKSNESGLILSEKTISILKENVTNIDLFPALGASLRLEAFSDNDYEISFLDTKPNELYRHHRILSSLSLVRKATIFTAIILIFTHLLFYSVITNIVSRKSIFSSEPPKVYANVSTIKNEAKQLNEIIDAGSQIVFQIKKFSPKIKNVDGIFTEGIYPNSITINNIASPISISGIAATRSQYNEFRTSLTKMHEITIISFPLGNLSLQANIPFSITINTIE